MPEVPKGLLLLPGGRRLQPSTQNPKQLLVAGGTIPFQLPGFFLQMLAGPGAVRKTLRDNL